VCRVEDLASGAIEVVDMMVVAQEHHVDGSECLSGQAGSVCLAKNVDRGDVFGCLRDRRWDRSAV
jgi:hypothetical protein